MIAVNAQTMREVAGERGERQAEIIDAVGPKLQATLAGYGIDTPLRVAHFLGQTCHESAGFSTTEELAGGDDYEGREDLGNTRPGDGRRYKGRGLIQLTGRSNYREYGPALGVDLEGDPEQAAEPVLSLRIACEYWKRRDINPRCDEDDIEGVTEKINGGTNGLAERRKYTEAAKKALAAADPAPVPEPKPPAPPPPAPPVEDGDPGVKVNPGVEVGPTGQLLVRILGHYPKKDEIYITSANRPGSGDHHGGLTHQGSPTAAVDIGAGGVTPEGSCRMRDVAKWLYDTFADLTVELIHTTPFADDQGFYVKDQRQHPNGGGVYDRRTMAEHRDHVHFATSRALAEEILARLEEGSKPPAPPPPPPPPPTPPVEGGDPGVKVNPGVRVGPTGRLLVEILGHYPKKDEIHIIDAYRPGSGDHHGGLSYQGSPTAAVDVGAGGLTPEGSRRMRDVAKWLYNNFADLIVEQIHTTPYADDQGFYVKNQVRRPNGGGVYDRRTMAEHRDHVHFATSRDLAEKILARLGK